MDSKRVTSAFMLLLKSGAALPLRMQAPQPFLGS